MSQDIGYEEFDRRRPGFFSRLLGTYQREVISAKLMFNAEFYYINLTVKKYRIFTAEWYTATTVYKVKSHFMGEQCLDTWNTTDRDAAFTKLENVRQAVKFIRY